LEWLHRGGGGATWGAGRRPRRVPGPARPPWNAVPTLRDDTKAEYFYAYAAQDPINGYDLDGLMCWSPTCLAKAALGNPIVRGAAVGLGAAAVCAGTAGLGCVIVAGAGLGAAANAANYHVNKTGHTSRGYVRAGLVGGAEGALSGTVAGSLLGKELSIGKNLRIAPGGNRGKGYFQRPHYHRKIVDSNGKTVPGGSKDWHRPWEKGW
jgi:hypothetical protein